MNSRGSVNEIVTFTTDLATLNQLDVKEPLLSFPFDHLYACHSESGDQAQALELDKEVEISTHCVVTEDSRASARRLASLESQNKKLKDLLIYHLDLIQQQNDCMSKKEKVFKQLKEENEALKLKVSEAELERRLPQRQTHLPVQSSSATITSASLHTNVASTSSENYFDTLNEILSPRGLTNQFNTFNTDLTTPKFPGSDVFDLVRSTDSDLANYLSSDLGMPSILEGTLQNTSLQSPSLQLDPFTTMIENKRPSKSNKKEPKPIEVNKEPKYTVTTNSGHQKIQRNRKRSSGVGSLSRMPKTIKPETTIPTTIQSDIYNIDNIDESFQINKKTKMSYGNSKHSSKYSLPYSGLSDKLQLIDPIPPGADPYQLGEAEMRAQSPIPKLMLQKNNHGRVRIFSESMSSVTSTITSATSSKRVYDTMSSSTSKTFQKTKHTDTYGTVSLHPKSRSRKDSVNALQEEPELDVVKTDGDIDWQVFTTGHARPKETSLCDFSYGESSANLLKNPLDISKMSFNEIFDPSPVHVECLSSNELELVPEKNILSKTKKRGGRTASLAGSALEETMAEAKHVAGKRGRKRALSTAGQRRDSTTKAPAKPRARRATRVKKDPVPGKMTKEVYHTSMGDPDVSWYLGLDPDIKKEDCEVNNASSKPNVEVPRWRVKIYPSNGEASGEVASSEEVEDLDDKVFEKRHQKYEAEERRQLRWHMRRVREQRHVERLRQRQRDPWGPNSSQSQTPADYTVWPQPLRDLQYIEITDTLPVQAFGEDIPDLPEKSFGLPWVLRSRAQKRSKRSKTLH